MKLVHTNSELKSHLANCEKILDKFIKKHNIILAYLVINDCVTTNCTKKLNLKVNSEFDDLKVKEVHRLLVDLNEEFKKYLIKNGLEYPLYINSRYRGWAVDKIIFKFEITN